MNNTDNDFPYVILMPTKQHKWQMTEWCQQQFGKGWSVVDNRQGVWRCFWSRKIKSREYDTSVYEWSFKNKKDAILFTLRWV